MKLIFLFIWLFAVLPLEADQVFLGSIGTEIGVPIEGQEDIVIYSLTGPVYGCSTPNGTPVCTPVTFDNATLTVNTANGITPLSLGNLVPGVTETYNLPDGTFTSGSITSLAFAATLSLTTLQEDIGPPVSVDPSISLENIPVDGTLAGIEATAEVAATPEPSFSLSLALFVFVLCFAHFWRRSANRLSKQVRKSL